MEIPQTGFNEAGRTDGGAARFLAPLAVFAVTVACFLTTMRNGFVNWDDPLNFLRNVDYQSASWDAVFWAFTTRHGGHYQPLNWLTFIADHALTPIVGPAGPRAGDDRYLVAIIPHIWVNHPPSAGRFHQTQALLHGIAALLLYCVARRLLDSADRPRWLVQSAAVVAALAFGLHPLRVESVAWASARTDILATIFMLSATLAYLKGLDQGSTPTDRSRLAVALLMLLALGSKVMAVTLPAVLLVVDAYRGRFGVMPSRKLVVEKAELFCLAIAGAVVAGWAHAGAISDFASHSMAKRLAQVTVSLAFYPYKTLVPIKLSPLYEFPVGFGLTHRIVLYSLAALVIAALILALVRFRKRREILCALAAYVILISPVSGMTQRGPQMVADRYSYIACIPFALLAGGLFLEMAQRKTASFNVAAVLTFGIFSVMIIQTQRQIRLWHDSVQLWERAIELDRTNATAYACLGSALDSAGMPDRALELFRKSVSIRHTQPDAWFSLGNLYRKAHRNEDAIQCYLTQLEMQPRHHNARMQLCLTLSELDRLAEAEPHLRILLADPARADDALVRHMLADACAERGAFDEALRLIDESIAIARKKNQTALVDELVATREDYLKFMREAESAASQPTTTQSGPK